MASSSENYTTHASSDSDIPISAVAGKENINTKSRNKRPCPNFSPTNQLSDVKEEIKAMLATWKVDQDSQITKLCEQQTALLNRLVSDVADLKKQTSVLRNSNLEIEKSMSFINGQFEDMKKQINSLQKERDTYRSSISHLESVIQDLQMSSRSSTIELRNIPTNPNETPLLLTSIVSKLGAMVNVDIAKTEVRDVYRLPGKTGTIRPIVAELNSVQTKVQLLESVRNFNKNRSKGDILSTQNLGIPGEPKPVYIAEHLSPSMRKLYFKAREFSKQNKYMFCWTKNGAIYLRKKPGDKHVRIVSEVSLTDIPQNL
ncbi:uncharacterized protein LOC142985986 [Anticarsia gemmatalis]|uniref:uncharacterized protein LOC142985986 n=1 Tax=Anticarsia gemmatalis TaxID=129554 RepID=UPI003F769DE5